MNRVIGLAIIVGGLCLVFAGLLVYTGWPSWFGRLPGDVRYESEHVRVYVPIVSIAAVVAGAELDFLFAPSFLLSHHQPVSFSALQSQLARRFLQSSPRLQSFAFSSATRAARRAGASSSDLAVRADFGFMRAADDQDHLARARTLAEKRWASSLRLPQAISS